MYVNHGARLQRAMINFFLDENRAAGYTEYQPPHFVNAASGYGTGQLPDKEGQMYEMPLTDSTLFQLLKCPSPTYLETKLSMPLISP